LPHARVVVAAIQRAEQDLPPEQRLLGRIDALPILLPTDEEQRDRVALAGELRALVDRLTPAAEPGSSDAQLLADLRPPDDLRPIGFADLPERLRRVFTEQDG